METELSAEEHIHDVTKENETTNTVLSETEESTEELRKDFVFQASGLSYKDLMKEACEERKNSLADPFNETVTDYYKSVSADLITDEEAEALLQQHVLTSDISKEELIDDVNLLFRLFESTYGSYYFFGEDNFRKANENILNSIETSGKDSFSKKEIASLFSQEFLFLRDAHFAISYDGFNSQSAYSKNYKKRYYFCSGFEFEKDEAGYYQMDEDIRWNLSEVTNDSVSIEPTLLEDGRIVYSPVLLCSQNESMECEFVLTDGEGNKITKTPEFKGSQTPGSGEYFRLSKYNGVSYVKIQTLNEMYQNILEEYAKAGSEIRDSRLIIYDLRSNEGGDSNWAAEFTANYLDVGKEQVREKILDGVRQSKLFKKLGYEEAGKGDGSYTLRDIKGIWHENSTPIIVLVDDTVGSSGEHALQMIKTLDNVIVIGSNTKGAQIAGNVSAFCLPNTGISFTIGSTLSFNGTQENIDYIGYMPDVWCDPRNALNAVAAMIKREDPQLADAVNAVINGK